MFYLIGGLLGLFFYAFYLALMAVVWAIGTIVVVIGTIVLVTVEYLTQGGREVKTGKGTVYKFKGNDIISTWKK
jgi:hypothetical protein